MFMDGGKVRYLGALSGLSKVVNYHEVKLRAEDIVERAKQDKAPAELNILPARPLTAPEVKRWSSLKMSRLVMNRIAKSCMGSIWKLSVAM